MNAPTDATPTDVPPIDRASLVERCMGDAAFACLILGKFQARAAEMVRAVERAAAASDPAAAGRAAHALKGAAANLSAEGVRSAAGAIEAGGYTGDVAAIATLMTPLRAAMEQCLGYVPRLTDELRQAPPAIATAA